MDGLEIILTVIGAGLLGFVFGMGVGRMLTQADQ
jgi:NhaP-type Na+/H+ or K+/H+ antiporter